MSEFPVVKPSEWISVGEKGCVVAAVYEQRSPGEIEVVYLDDRNRAINEDVIWSDGQWTFKHSRPSGGYADKSTRLEPYVRQLRRGK